MRHTAAVALIVLLTCSVSLADGMFVVKLSARAAGRGIASSAAQKAVIIRDGADEVLLLQTTYSGPASAFAWVVPVPSQPAPGDIFVASSDFIKGAMLTTQPTVHTRVTDLWERHKWDLNPLFATAGTSVMRQSPRVTVWQKLLLGNYEAAVLSATNSMALLEWLRSNGYAVPATLAPVAEEYVRKHWYFVAVKINPAAVAGQALLQDVQPLGLRFKTDRLVYPLRISTVSAPEQSALLLVVYAPQPVKPRELPLVTLPHETKLAPGGSYHALVRRVLAQHQGRALLLESQDAENPNPHEARGAEWLASYLLRAGVKPDDLLKGIYRGESHGPAVADWKSLIATRFYGLLPREAMMDLTFEPGSLSRSSVTIDRHCELGHSVWANVIWWRWPLLLLVAFLAVWAHRRQEDLGKLPRQLDDLGRGRVDSLSALLVWGFLAMLPCSVLIEVVDDSAMINIPIIALALFLMGSVAFTMICARHSSALLPQLRPTQTVLSVALGVMILVLLAGGTVPELAPVLVTTAWLVLGLGVLLAALTVWIISKSPIRQFWFFWASLGFFVIALLPSITARIISSYHMADKTGQQLDGSLRLLDQALGQFRDTYHCYPANLSDLTNSQPSRGLDASGNPVAITLAGRAEPILARLPVDPLTGRRDSWVYDVLSSGLVDSGGYLTTVHLEQTTR